jgi:precorrin-4 methylase
MSLSTTNNRGRKSVNPTRLILFLAVVAMVAMAGFSPSDVLAWGRGHLYVIGIGPAGPEMATLQALNTIKRMDAIVAPEGPELKLFAEYVGDKPILFDPWKGLFDYNGKSYRQLNKEELAGFKVEHFRLRDERVEKIKALLAEGKDVGLLDCGNPCLFGPSHWYVEQFKPGDVVIIPGMGSDAAAMAALGRSTIPSHDTRFVMQTAPMFLMDWAAQDRQILKDLAKYPTTMVLYMAMYEPVKLFAALGQTLPPDMPCAAVFWAGHPDRQRIVRGTVADMGEKLANDTERYMGLLFIGRFLEGKPYETAIKRADSRFQPQQPHEKHTQ